METVRDRLRSALPAAMKAKDTGAVKAIRSALGALDNATSAGVAAADPATATAHPDIAGSIVGVGAAEVARRELTETEAADLVRAEIAERLDAAVDYERSGRTDAAEALRHEAQVLERVL